MKYPLNQAIQPIATLRLIFCYVKEDEDENQNIHIFNLLFTILWLRDNCEI